MKRRIHSRWGGRLTMLLVSLLLTHPASADIVAELPPPWVGQVSAVPELDVSGGDPVLQRATAETREELATLLADPQAERAAIGDAYGRLGAYYHLQKVITGAERCYRNATVLDSEELRWHYYLGTLLLEDGRAEAALKVLGNARRMAPDYQPLTLKLARADFALNRLEEAERGFRAVTLEPGLKAMAYYYLGQIALQRREHQRAAAWFEMVLEQDPEADRVRYPLAQALRAMGQAERAREELARHGQRLPAVKDPLAEELEALNSGARPYFIRAMGAIKRQEYGPAVKEFAAGLKLAPDNVHARISYARALYLHGKREQSRKQLERAILADPKSSLASFLLALILDEAGDTEAAGGLYVRTLQLDPEHAGAHYYLAGRLFLSRDYTAAAGHYADTLLINPEIDVAVLLRMVSLKRSGSTDAETVALLDTLLETRPHDTALRYAAVRLLALSPDPAVRDPERALELAKALAERMPAPPHIALLALATAANGDLEQARETTRQLAVRLPPWGAEGVDIEKLEQAIDAFAAGTIPGPPWPLNDPVLQPPPVQAGGPMREYPATLSY